MIKEFLNSLDAWTTSAVTTTVQPRPRHQVLAIADSVLAPVVAIQDQPYAAASSSSSSAIVPYVAPQIHETDEQSFALGQLYEKGGMRQHVNFNDLAFVSYETVQELHEQRLVTFSQSEFGELQIALAEHAVVVAPAYAVTAPMAAYKVGGHAQVLKQSKVSLLLRLHEDGWRPAADVVPFVPGGPLIYRPGMTQPLSYFAALLEHERIFQKAVPSIKHQGTNYYYRCLLCLPADKLAVVLAEAGADDDFYKKHVNTFMKKRKDADSSTDSDEGGVPRARRPRLEGAIVPILAPNVDPIERVPWRLSDWRRCFVLLDGRRIKVWFDNCCASNAVRRGWANCATHRCGRIRPVMENRDYFACGLALWHAHGVDVAMTRAEHMAFWPDDGAIRAALPRCAFEEF